VTLFARSRAAVRGGAFLAIVGLMVVLQRAVPADAISEYRTTGLALGFALVAATLVGNLADTFRLPRLSGYLIFGLACGPYVANLLTPVMARQLQLVNGLAITLIALVAGLEINIVRMRRRLGPMMAFGSVTILSVFVGLLTLFVIAWPWLPIAPDATGLQRLALPVVLTTLVVSFSPTVTIAVMAESRARGPLSELVLTVVILADLALILFFTLAMQFARSVSGVVPADDISLLTRLFWEVAGSLAYGTLLGSLFALYLRLIGREITVVLLALCVLVTGTSALLHFEALLVALAAGLAVENIAPFQGDALHDAVERGALPLLVVFFVAAGANLNLHALAELGWLALALSGLRLVGLWLGACAGRRVARLDTSETAAAWTGLVAQAGVTFGLAGIVATEFRDWGMKVQTLVVAIGALNVLIGPMLFRAALVQAGEIGRLDSASPVPTESSVRVPNG